MSNTVSKLARGGQEQFMDVNNCAQDVGKLLKRNFIFHLTCTCINAYLRIINNEVL